MVAVRPRSAALLVLLSLVAGLAPSVGAQDGWRLNVASGASSMVLRRGTPHLALEDGQTLHPELGLDFHAELSARAVLPEPGRWRFGVEVHGAQVGLRHGLAPMEMFELRALGEQPPARRLSEWFETTRENQEVDLQLVFKTVRRGPRRLVVFWERAVDEDGGFPLEPLPWWAVRGADPDAPAPDGDRARAGRSLLAVKGCTACHAPAPAMAHAVERPVARALDGLGDRLQGAWLARWLDDPAALRPGSAMPDLLADAATRDDLVAWLLSLAERPAPHHMGRGADLYHTRGCIACHQVLLTEAGRTGDAFADRRRPGEPPAAPLGDLAGKWTLDGLRAALEDPAALHADWLVDTATFDQAEAFDLASFLIGAWQDPPRREDGDQLVRGRRAFDSLGCGACHTVRGVETAAPAAPALADLRPGHGCLDPADAGTPRYDLSDDERRQLELALASVARASGVPAPLDLAERRLAELSCLACHTRDGEGGLEPVRRLPFTTLGERADLGDEGRLPPDLSLVGQKLNRRGLADVLVEGHRRRPWMAATMPRFQPGRVAPLVDGLAQLDGVPPGHDVPWPTSGDDAVLAGRELAGSGGLACVTCHAVGPHDPPGTVGLDLLSMAERLRYDWFARYMHEPARFKRDTRMPAFGEGGRSVLTDVLDGDLSAQAEALWSWMALGDDAPLPDGVDRGQGLAVPVGERPVVLRTFLEEAGARGIAVGFPVGLHLAWDADRAGPAAVWSGAFLDASGAWAGRGGHVSGGRGELLWTAPEGPALGLTPARWGGAGEVARFAGYRLDDAGVPTFLARLGPARVADRIEPRRLPVPTWVRTLQISELLPGQVPWLADDPRQTVLAVDGGRAVPSELDGRPVQLIQPDPGAHTVTLILELVP